MDKHHVAHYLIALSLAGALIAVVYELRAEHDEVANAIGIGHLQIPTMGFATEKK